MIKLSRPGSAYHNYNNITASKDCISTKHKFSNKRLNDDIYIVFCVVLSIDVIHFICWTGAVCLPILRFDS